MTDTYAGCAETHGTNEAIPEVSNRDLALLTIIGTCDLIAELALAVLLEDNATPIALPKGVTSIKIIGQ
jgi:hypothetical protein